MRSVSNKIKWTYAIGNMPFAVKDAAFANFVVFYYTQVQGLSGTLTGLAMLIALSWDAISDPVVGSWSDSFRSRWGRRHPLLVVGGIPTSLLFLALFVPPEGLGDMGVFAWLLCVSILLRTFLTIYFIPYSALGAELSTNYDERTDIGKSRVSMGWLAGMILPAVAFSVFFKSTGGVDGRLVVENYWHYGILSALVALVSALVCIIGTWSAIPGLPTNHGAQTFSWADPLRDLLLAFKNYNFRISTGANLAFGLSNGVYTALALYMGTYFWEFSTDQLAGLVVPTAMATIAAFMALNYFGRRYDKPFLLAATSLFLAINAVWFVGARLAGWLPANGHELIYPLMLLNSGLSVFFVVSMQSLAVSLTADILDEQELKTKKRQEGVMFAAGLFVQKATIGIGIFVAGIVIDVSGFVPGSIPGQVDAEVLYSLGLFALLATMLTALVAFFFNLRLRLSREDHMRTSAALSTLKSEEV